MFQKIFRQIRYIFVQHSLVIDKSVERNRRTKYDKIDAKSILINFRTSWRSISSIYSLFKASRKMANANPTEAIVPPKAVQGMTVLNRNAFSMTAQVPCVYVPISKIQNMMKHFRKYLIKLQGVKPIANLPAENEQHKTHKIFLFDPGAIASISEKDKSHLESNDVSVSQMDVYDLELRYENWRYDDILDAVLAKEEETIGGFSQIGHIIHLNLRDQLLPFKNLIGEVLLDKVPSCRSVVNKVGTIDNKYRNFAMELLAGENDMVATTKEEGITYKFDFSKVYWNPRLSTEHKRMVENLKVGDVVYDVFAGVGPFAVPAAKKGIRVLANDLNPDSYGWLQENGRLNKVKDNLLVYNLDGREFIRTVVKQDLLHCWMEYHKFQETRDLNTVHFFMNLPALAVEFLDVFTGLYNDTNTSTLKKLILPRVHCYCFSKSDNPHKDAQDQVQQVLGCAVNNDSIVRSVRNVAPNKEMMCVSFTLSVDILFSSNTEHEPVQKRVKTDVL